MRPGGVFVVFVVWGVVWGVACGGGADKPGEIAVDQGTRADAVSAARGLGFGTSAMLTIDQALADVDAVLAPGNPLEVVAGTGHVLGAGIEASGSWANAGSCAALSNGSMMFSACAVGSGDTLDGSVSYGAGRFQASLTITPYLIGTYAFGASLQTSGSHIAGTGQFTRDLIPAAAPPDGLHEVMNLDIDVGFDSGCPTSGSIRLTSSSSKAPSSTVEVDYGPDCGDARFYP